MNKLGLVETNKQMAKIAILIRNQILSLTNKISTTTQHKKNIQNIEYILENIKKQDRLKNKAFEKNWFLAAKRLEYGENGTIQSFMNKIVDNAEKVSTYIDDFYNPPNFYLPSFSEIMKDIQATKKTFPSLSYKDHILSVKTNKITLSDGDNEIELGDFNIKFNLDTRFDSRLGNILEIEALDPNPAQGRSNITHPHVDSGSLCAGEDPKTGATGDSLIRQALQQGRIEDAFKLVLLVLDNYNEDSPYVHLYEWNGEVYSCTECGADDLTEDTIYSCEFCDQIFCENCISSCDKCSRSMCMECATRCNQCDNVFCEKCLTNSSCGDCGETICENCVETCKSCGNNRCSECLKGCDSCDAKICNECKVECEECSTEMCGDCLMKCENCNKILCAECNEKDSCNMFAKV